MMKKSIICLLLAVMAMPLAAVLPTLPDGIDSSDPNVLNIKAYKIGKVQTVNVVITDAISASLDTIDAPVKEGDIIKSVDEIVVDDKVLDLLGNISSTSNSASFSSDKVIFSYRVVGNIIGTFTLGITFNSLSLDGKGIEIIGTKYDLGNLSYSFPAYSSSTFSDGTGSGEISNNSTAASTGSITTSTGGKVSSSWEVDVSDTTVPLWIHRGAIAMTVSDADYRSEGDGAKPIGEYRSRVIVTLEDNN